MEGTESSELPNSLVALGRKLVEELGLDDSTDTLGRWMAHHIADLIAKAGNATGKIAAEHECFAAILALWKHHSALPNGKRPFEQFEPVLRALESLDPEKEGSRYYRVARPPKEESAETGEQKKWLDLVERLDYSAKVLIGFCLTEAAGAALDKSKEWIKLAEAIDDEGGLSHVVIRFASTVADANREPDPNEEVRSLLHDRLARLRGFVEAAKVIADSIEERLQALPAAKDVASDDEILTLGAPPPAPGDLPKG